MATLIKQKSWYSLQFYNPTKSPVRKKIALRTSKKGEALKVKALLESRYLNGQIDPWTMVLRPPDWGLSTDSSHWWRQVGEAVEAFLQSRKGCRKATQDHYRWVLSSFVSHLGPDTPLQAVGASDILDWLDSVGRTMQTRHTYTTRVGIAFRWMTMQGWIEIDPSKALPLPRLPQKFASKLITEEQLKEILEEARASSTPYIGDVAVVAFDLALRLGEVCAMRCGWYNGETGLITVMQDDSFSTKSGKDIIKPITRRASKVLNRLTTGREAEEHLFLNSREMRLDPKHTSKRFKKIVRKAGLPESITFHGLRHGGISSALAGGASIEAVRRFAGHTKVDMTMKYVHLQQGQLEEQIREAMET